jgi:hypothetical protein
MPKPKKQPENLDTPLLSREVAYGGAIGQKRAAFCIEYIDNKRKILEKFRADQIRTVTDNGETVSCGRGCSHCCLAYMQANIQECEAIVYYLYQQESVLASFLINYREWREKLRQNGDIFQECGQLWENKSKPGAGGADHLALQEAEKRYQQQNLHCPFLCDDGCLIYDVRPFTCAALVSSSPSGWCNPSSANRAKTYVTRIPEIYDSSFYYSKIDQVILGFMPLVVYGILKDGYYLLSKIPGLEDLDKEE